jgi:hypothetical protein
VSHDILGRQGNRRHLAAIVLLASSFLGGAPARAQDAGEDPDEDDVVQVERFEVSAEVFDSWTFRHGQTPETIRLELENRLKLQIDDVDRIGKLDDAQRRKLQLAGRGDIKRYFDDVEALRQRFNLLRKDREKFNEIWKEIQPLQQRLAAGLFEEGSIFRKTLGSTLSADQASRYQKSRHDRRAFRFQAEVEWVVAMLENVMPLGGEQRRKLIQLLLDRTKPPRTFGEYDSYIILWQLNRLPEDTLKEVFDDAQWQLLTQQFTNLKGAWDHLKKNRKLWLEGEDAPVEPEQAPPATKS